MTLAIVFSIIFIIIISILLFVVFNFIDKMKANTKLTDSEALYAYDEITNISGKLKFSKHDTGKTAVVRCSSDRQFKEKRLNYSGRKDCSLFKSIYSTASDCNYGCVGFGNCVRACPRNAISIVNNTAVIHSTCNGCGFCVKLCPMNLIELIPVETKECRLCNVPEGQCSSCSMFNKTSKLNSTDQKGLSFWKKFYKLFFKN